MDLYDYKVIYKDADKQLLVNKTELNYSIVLKEGDAYTEVTKFGASPPSFTAENPVVFSEHHHPKTLKTL